MSSSSNRAFALLLAATAAPLAAIAFAVVRGAHDLPATLADAPAPVAGVCRDAIVKMITPLAHVSYAGVAVLALASVGFGLVAALSSHARARRRLRSASFCGGRELPPRLRDMAARLGIARVRLLDSAPPQAFTFGYVRPTVCVSRGLLARLGADELEAVLRHEAEHVRSRDPLRVLIVTAISRALVFAPLARRLGDAFHVEKEIDADRAVIRGMGGRHALVSALLAAAPVEASAAVGFADTLSARIAWLEGEGPLPGGPAGWRPVALTIAAILAIAGGLFVIVTGAVDAHVLHVCGRGYLSP